jgi:hypothetical protein
MYCEIDRVTRIRNFAFALTFGLLSTHELDAVRWAEWRVLPITRFFPENIAMVVFVLAHVPLFGWLSLLCWSENLTQRMKTQRMFAGFCCVHVGLHWLYRNDLNYEFTGWLSNGLIGGAGLTGAVFLMMSWQNKRPYSSV